MPATYHRRGTDPDIAETAALIGDRVRAQMLLALLDGGELPASELAFRGGSSRQAASAHLSKLVEGGLLAVHASGRHRLFKLASRDVAEALERLVIVAKPARIVALGQSETMQRLREARSCYDHLAGRIGVLVTERLVDKKALALQGDDFRLTRSGERLFSELGVNVEAAREHRRSFARVCIDWTERRPHLAGSLGACVLKFVVAKRWLIRNPHDRSLQLTPDGRSELARRLHIRV